jgi:hypothetical protein
MHIAYDILQNAQPGQKVHMVAGAKDGTRFRGQAEGYRPEGVELDVEPMPNVMDPDSNPPKPMSATMFREAVESGGDITKFIPETSHKSIKQIKQILGGDPGHRDMPTSDMLFDLVHEAMDNRRAGGDAGNPIKAWPEIQQGIMDRLGGLQDIPAIVGDGIMAGAERTAGETVDQIGPLVGAIPQEIGGMLDQFGGDLEAFAQDLEKREKMQKLQQTQQELAEVSAAGGGAVEGGGVPDEEELKKKKKNPTIFREDEEKDLIDEIAKYFLKTAG